MSVCIIVLGWSVYKVVGVEHISCATYFIFQWAMGDGRRMKALEVASILQNRILSGSLGIFFQKWLLDGHGSGLKLTVPATESGCSNQEFLFKGTRIIHERRLQAEVSIIYKLDRATFPSIEGYARAIHDAKLLLLQSTVSETHSAARFNAVKSIIREVGYGLQILVVYVAPSDVNFVLPTLVDFSSKVMAVRAYVDDSDFIAAVKLDKEST
jgi:hypothetical protein